MCFCELEDKAHTYLTYNNPISHVLRLRLRFEWADIIYPVILSDNQLFELYHLCLEVHCKLYELHLFMDKAFPLLNLIMTRTG